MPRCLPAAPARDARTQAALRVEDGTVLRMNDAAAGGGEIAPGDRGAAADVEAGAVEDFDETPGVIKYPAVEAQSAAIADLEARLLATCPVDQFRDGKRAVELSRQLIRQQKVRNSY